MRLAVTLLLLAMAPFLALAAPRSDKVAVIGAPWTDEPAMMAIVARAGGLAVSAGGHANVMIAQGSGDDFVPSLYRAGAWLVVSTSFASACLSPTSRTTS